MKSKASGGAAAAAWALWGWPVVFALVSAAGLVGALAGNGGWDWLAWTGLGLPTFAALWFGLRGLRSANERP